MWCRMVLHTLCVETPPSSLSLSLTHRCLSLSLLFSPRTVFIIRAFNQPLGDWDVSRVTYMGGVSDVECVWCRGVYTLCVWRPPLSLSLSLSLTHHVLSLSPLFFSRAQCFIMQKHSTNPGRLGYFCSGHMVYSEDVGVCGVV